MNVLEKEASLLEALDNPSVEHSSPFRVARGTLALNPGTAGHSGSALSGNNFSGHGSSTPVVNGSHSKAHRPPLVRDLRPLSPAEVRRFIAERSEELQRFVAPLEEEIRRAAKFRSRERRSTKLAAGKVAELVLAVIRKIADRETGVFGLEPNVPLLLSTLYAGSVEAAIVSGLVRRAQAALAAVAAEEEALSGQGISKTTGRHGEYYDIGRELDELTMLLKWYVRRKMSLAGLEVDHLRDGYANPYEGDSVPEGYDALFGFEVLHDHQVFGAKGCFVTCGLRLVGHDGQALWLRVSVRWNGSPVSARPEWSSWTDPGSDAPLEVMSENVPFSSLVPIRPNAQRLVIDDIRAFIPYAALDLPAGRCDVELILTVVDNDGTEILSASREESICVPRRELVSTNIPAPHSVGMWPHDVVSGDRISELRVASGYKVLAGWERHTITVSFDLSMFMHAGESVLLECRFLDERGELVELSSLGIPYIASDLNVPVESVSSYRYRRILHPKGAWAHYRGLCIEIPVEFLLLQEGLHHLTCEVVIVSSDDRVLCGDMGLVTVAVPASLPAGSTDARDGVLGVATEGLSSAIELESIEVDSAWQHDGEECVRIQATFCPKNAARRLAEIAAGRLGELFSPYRVEISLEREDGHLLLQAFSDSLGLGFKPVTRGVCVEGHAGFSEHSVVANFPKEEILGWSFGSEGSRGVTKHRLFARVTALSLDGQLLLSESKEFFVKPFTGAGKRVADIGHPVPRIVDVVAQTYVQTPKLSCRGLLNIPHGRFLEDGVTIECSLLTSQGTRELIAKRTISLAQSGAWVRQQMGLSQIPVAFEHAIKSKPAADVKIELSLRAASGDLLQLVSQDLQVAGVLVDIDPSSDAGVSASGSTMVASAGSAVGVDQDGEIPAKSVTKSFFSWLRG